MEVVDIFLSPLSPRHAPTHQVRSEQVRSGSLSLHPHCLTYTRSFRREVEQFATNYPGCRHLERMAMHTHPSIPLHPSLTPGCVRLGSKRCRDGQRAAVDLTVDVVAINLAVGVVIAALVKVVFELLLAEVVEVLAVLVLGE